MSTAVLSSIPAFKDRSELNIAPVRNQSKTSLDTEKVIWVVTKVFLVLASMAITFAGTLYLGCSIPVCIISCLAMGIIIVGIFGSIAFYKSCKKIKQENYNINLKINRCGKLIKNLAEDLKKNSLKLKYQSHQLRQSNTQRWLLESKILDRLVAFESQKAEISHNLKEVEELGNEDIQLPIFSATRIHSQKESTSPEPIFSELSSGRQLIFEDIEEAPDLGDISEEEFKRMAEELGDEEVCNNH